MTTDALGNALVSGTTYYFKVAAVTETVTNSPDYVLDVGAPSNEIAVVCP